VPDQSVQSLFTNQGSLVEQPPSPPPCPSHLRVTYSTARTKCLVTAPWLLQQQGPAARNLSTRFHTLLPPPGVAGRAPAVAPLRVCPGCYLPRYHCHASLQPPKPARITIKNHVHTLRHAQNSSLQCVWGTPTRVQFRKARAKRCGQHEKTNASNTEGG
jgi:hypothetical protein